MAEFEESSLLFSLRDLFARERERVDLAEQAERAARAEQERRRREAARALQREQERLQTEREAREREHAARVEALKCAEIERTRVRELAASEAALLQARLDARTTTLERVERRARRWAVVACGVLGASAAFGAFYVFSERPRVDAAERELVQRLALEQQRAREIAALLERANQRSKSVPPAPASAPAESPAVEPVPAPRRPRGPARTRPRQVAPCVDSHDPLNPCLP